jgi:hypothetical protein
VREGRGEKRGKRGERGEGHHAAILFGLVGGCPTEEGREERGERTSRCHTRRTCWRLLLNRVEGEEREKSGWGGERKEREERGRRVEEGRREKGGEKEEGRPEGRR